MIERISAFNLREDLKKLVDEFLKSEDPLVVWSVGPDFDLNHAKDLIKETENLGVVLPQSAEDFLKCIHDEEFRTRHRAALILRLIGLRIRIVEELDSERSLGRLSQNFAVMAKELELGRLNPEDLLRT